MVGGLGAGPGRRRLRRARAADRDANTSERRRWRPARARVPGGKDQLMTERFDAVVVGAGPAGEVCAADLADHGMEVAIVQQELLGGEAANWAGIPSKALLRPTEAA